VEYCVGGHRFLIYEDIGCYPYTDNVWLGFILFLSWPVVIGIVSAVYGVLTVRACVNRVKDNMNGRNFFAHHRYSRMIVLALIEITIVTPLTTFFIIINVAWNTVAPYRGWADTHKDYSKVYQVPADEFRGRNGEIQLQVSRWALIFCAVSFFAIFGFSTEAWTCYRKVFWRSVKPFGLYPTSSAATSSLRFGAPVSDKNSGRGLEISVEFSTQDDSMASTAVASNPFEASKGSVDDTKSRSDDGRESIV